MEWNTGTTPPEPAGDGSLSGRDRPSNLFQLTSQVGDIHIAKKAIPNDL